MHQHVGFESGRTRAAQICPEKLCKAICIGLQKRIETDRKGQPLTMTMDNTRQVSSKELMSVAKQVAEEYHIVEEDDNEELGAAWDDVSGAALDPTEVKQIREEEVDYVHKMQLYDKVPVEECMRATGRKPISTRWVDINKGDATNPNYRSRLVARDFNIHKRNELFAATPPLEALKLIFAMTATANKGESIMINDISRALFHATVKRDVYIQMLGPEENQGKQVRIVNRVVRWHGERGFAYEADPPARGDYIGTIKFTKCESCEYAWDQGRGDQQRRLQ